MENNSNFQNMSNQNNDDGMTAVPQLIEHNKLQSPAFKKKIVIIVSFILMVILLFITLILIYSKNKKEKQLEIVPLNDDVTKTVNPTSSIPSTKNEGMISFTTKQENIVVPDYQSYPLDAFTGTIAYLENDTIFLLNKQEKKSLITREGISNFRWAPDGHYLYVIINQASEDKTQAKASVERIDITTLDAQVIFSQERSCPIDANCRVISDIGALNNHQLLIASQGLQKLDTKTGRITTLLEEKLIDNDDPYFKENAVIGINISPQGKYAILTIALFEGYTEKLFDLSTNKYLDTNLSGREWMNSDFELLHYDDCYQTLGGLSMVSIRDNNFIVLAGNLANRLCFPVQGALQIQDGPVIFTLKHYDDFPWTTDGFYNDHSNREICETFFSKDTQSCLPADSMGLILSVNPHRPEEFTVIKRLENIGKRKNLTLSGYNLSKSPNGKTISFLMPNENESTRAKYVYLIDFDSGKPTREGTLFSMEGQNRGRYNHVYLYQWSPLMD